MSKFRYLLRLVVALILSLVLHAAYIELNNWLETARPVARPIRRKPKSIHVRIVPAPTSTSRPALPRPTAARADAIEGRRASIRPARPPAGATATSSSPRVRAYEDLLPGPSYTHRDEGAQGFGEGDDVAAAPPEAQMAGDVVTTSLDVPLIFRERNIEARANAKLTQLPGGMIRFDYVDGEPLLRAVLFESLQEVRRQRELNRIFAALQTKELMITLHYLPVPGNLNGGGTTIVGKRIRIIKTLPAPSPPTSGIVLPDKDAEKAKARDRGTLDRLLQSRAYNAPVRNFQIRTDGVSYALPQADKR